MLSKARKTRFKIATYTNMFLGGLAIGAMYVGMEGVATTCIGGILTITTMYIGGDSYRKSESV